MDQTVREPVSLLAANSGCHAGLVCLQLASLAFTTARNGALPSSNCPDR